jgi:Mn-dependent DtxR family transcriptional regulator
MGLVASGDELREEAEMADMTPKQTRYLSYIHAYIQAFRIPPAEAEIAEALGVSPPSVNQMIKTLEMKGLIERQPGVARTIKSRPARIR